MSRKILIDTYLNALARKEVNDIIKKGQQILLSKIQLITSKLTKSTKEVTLTNPAPVNSGFLNRIYLLADSSVLRFFELRILFKDLLRCFARQLQNFAIFP